MIFIHPWARPLRPALRRFDAGGDSQTNFVPFFSSSSAEWNPRAERGAFRKLERRIIDAASYCSR